jgi:hypothetical protein
VPAGTAGGIVKRILAAAILLASVILAWQVGGAVKALTAASVARVSAENTTHDPRPVVSLPPTFVLNLQGGGSLTCRLGPRAYACTAAPLRDPVHGPTS